MVCWNPLADETVQHKGKRHIYPKHRTFAALGDKVLSFLQRSGRSLLRVEINFREWLRQTRTPASATTPSEKDMEKELNSK
jgi:hypothetical protein